MLKRLFLTQRNAFLALLSLSVLLSACGITPTTVVDPTAVVNQPTQPIPTPTLTPEPIKTLTVCMAEDPGSLFRYEGRESLAKQSVFAALYDAEILFENPPTYDNNQIVKTAVDVRSGMNVLDSSGKPAVLKEGTSIHPLLEGGLGEAAAWSSSAPLQMTQVSIEFKILPGLVWSDGSALTAADFLLSYEVALAARNPQDIWLLDRTESVLALDDLTVVWTGIPGFLPVDLSGLVFLPLPAAQFEGVNPEAIDTTVAANYAPLAWGAYRIVDRAPDLAIHMERNPYYSPKTAYDQVTFLVEPDTQTAIAKLSSGECDVLDASYHLEGQDKSILTGLAQSGSLIAENFELVQQLVFGIQPSAYDSGYSAWTAARQDYFGDLRARQAVAACLSVEPIAPEVLRLRLPDGFSLPDFASSGTLDQAKALLDEIGWLTDDSQPGSPRMASGVQNVLDGTRFSLSLLSGTSAMDREVSHAVVQRLAQCGIEVIHQALPSAELFAPGPEGLLFGRNFDLALVSWQQTSANNCELYSSSAIPNGSNFWIGTNLAGFSDSGFDAQCAAIGNEELVKNLPNGIDLMAEYLPALPLMPRVTLWAASSRVDLAGGEGFADISLWRPAVP